MIFEYAIFETIILILLLLFTISLIRPIIKVLAAKENPPAEGNRAVLKKIQLNVRIIFFFLVFILLGKIIFVLAFPAEINNFNYKIGFASDALVFYHLQIVSIIFYAVILGLIVMHDKFKPTYRYFFLNRVLLFTLVLSSVEILLTTALFIIEQYQFIWSLSYKTEILSKVFFFPLILNAGNSPLGYFLAFGLFVIYTVLFYWNIRRFNPLLQKIVFGLVLISLPIYSIILLNTWQPLFGTDILTKKIFFLLSFSGGYSAVAWFTLVAVIAVSQILTFFVSELKDKFIAVQLNTHYRLQLNRISYYAFSGLFILLIWPGMLFWFFK